MSFDALEWLSDWYASNCNGDWEHEHGVVIESLDNPGWSVSIDTEDTLFYLSDRPWEFSEKGPNDWYGYKIINGKFEATGDPLKLEFLINIFKNCLQSRTNTA